ncbi:MULTISPECIES: hypothetical protein [Holospora]|uniref:Uncharacterized protein n=2 Tax=Holospora TaxID=44747 RepID=A0A061JGJ3_9PROT|nr:MULTISPECIES: hypothetical protein [Holospora]ETZ05216.1 hypothetical protein K737_300348 [Holospora undulata HU1]GAJ45845.1 hypothetical protein HE1_00155 [Holospora elegans E1]
MSTPQKTSILTFIGFPFVMVALWEFDEEGEEDFSFEDLSSRVHLITQSHYNQDHADQELASLVQSIYTQGIERGNLSHVATFTAPGPFTPLRATVALLDGLHAGASFRAHYWNLFQVLFSKHCGRSNVLWAVDNGRQAWSVGYMMLRKMVKDLVLEVREDVSQASLEKFHIHCQEDSSISEPWETYLLWRHTPVEDVLEILKKFALSILYEDVMIKRKMKTFEEKMLNVSGSA